MCFEFEERSLIKGNVKVMLDWIGEGYSGDYDEDDPEDERLLRFYVFVKEDGCNTFRVLDDASGCTMLSADLPDETIEQALEVLLANFHHALSSYPEVRGVGDATSRMTYLSEEVLQRRGQAREGLKELIGILEEQGEEEIDRAVLCQAYPDFFSRANARLEGICATAQGRRL